jgi:hypothetical protein
MAYVDWRIKGLEVATCNCAWGCPCQFNALPTYGDCRAAIGYRIDEGHFGGVDLAGLFCVALYAWPGPIHEGRGEMLIVVEERATPEQRAALVKIFTGAETEPGATIYNVFAATIERVHAPLVRPIVLEADGEARQARISVVGLVEATVEPIRNPVTGEPHQARLVLPRGIGWSEAEIGSGSARAAAPIALQWTNRHAHFGRVHLSTRGPVRAVP